MKIITYIVLGLLLAVSGYAAVQWTINRSQAGQIAALETRVQTAEGTLIAIGSASMVSDELTRGMTEAIAAIGDRGVTVTERVVRMERENEEVRDLLGTRLPDAGCMLDDTCAASEGTATRRLAVDSLPAAAPAKVRGSARSGQ